MLRCTNPSRSKLVLLLALFASALPAAAAMAAPSCLPLSQRNKPADIDLFRSEPTRYLVFLKGDQSKIKGFVANFIASDSDLLVPLRQFIARSTSVERRAIGMGLANASERCANTQPGSSSDIVKYIDKLNDPDISAGFLSSMPGKRVTLPTARQVPRESSQSLLEGEFGDKLADPFAPITIPQ